jgi:hypothetical protein
MEPKKNVTLEYQVTDNCLKSWEESGDEFMIELRKAYIEQKTPPNEDEAAEMLGFLCSFSVGCARLDATEAHKNFSRRADLYVTGLKEMGYRSGWIQIYLKNRRRCSLDKILLRASSMVKGLK